MHLLVKRILVVLAAITGILTLAAATLVVGTTMWLSGTWPFQPLDRIVRETQLSKGQIIQAEGIEDRGWGSDGYMWTARFRQDANGKPEVFAYWSGYENALRVYESGGLIVLINPNGRMLHVRGLDAEWRFFDLSLPGKSDNLVDFMQFHPALPEDNLREFQSGLTRVEEGFSPATIIEDFDPSSLELRVRVLTSAQRDAVFDVSEDGERVQLKSLRLHVE